MINKIELLGFTPSDLVKDLYNLNTASMKLSVMVIDDRIQSVGFQVDKHKQPEYEYQGMSLCKLYITKDNKERLIYAVQEVAKGNNRPWVDFVNPMTNPRLVLK